MKKYLSFKNIAVALLVIFILMQFIRIDKTNPPLDMTKDFLAITNPPEDINMMVKSACYDCHSHEVKYPWYTNVAPLSFFIKGHIDEGIKHLNFSTWGTLPDGKASHKLEECVEMMEKQDMPLSSYALIHPEARLSDTQYAQLEAFFKSEFSKY